MTATRWMLILVAAGALAAATWFTTREPADQPAAVPAGSAASPLSLLLPTTADGATAGPASTATRAEPRAPGAAPAASAPRVGSEGYGPHIERAQVGNDAKAAWEAVQWLRNCFSNEAARSSFEHTRGQGVVPELMTQLMVEADAEGRRCQTVTAQHRALLPELAARAMRAGVPEAAAAYANATFANDLTPSQRLEVVEAMRRDAQSADALSLLGALTANEAWGLSEAEKLAYLAAYISLPGQPGNKTLAKALMDQGTIRFKTPPTAERLEAVKPAVQQILDRVQARLP